MKKVIFIIAALTCLTAFILPKSAKSQIVKGEAFVGLNLSQVDGDDVYGYRKFGFQGGLGAIVPIFKRDNFSIDGSIEVLYNQKGSHQVAQYNENDDGKNGAYDLYLNYAEVPLLIYFSDKNLVSFGIGASYGRLVSLREYEHGKKTSVTLNSGEYKVDDYDILLDVKLRVYEQFKIGVRYQYSMAKIRTREFYDINNKFLKERDQYNNMFTLRLIWVFNEDRSNFIREEYQFDGDPKFHQKALDRKLKKMKRKEAREARKSGKE